MQFSTPSNSRGEISCWGFRFFSGFGVWVALLHNIYRGDKMWWLLLVRGGRKVCPFFVGDKRWLDYAQFILSKILPL